MRVTATRRLQYAIGHRVFGHEGKCKHLHGHNFVFFLTAEAEPVEVKAKDYVSELGRLDRGGLLDALGRVIDFGVLKSRFDPWFCMHWDHGMVLGREDDEGQAAVRMAHSKLFVLPYNPTAENLARFVLEILGPALLKDTGVRLVKVEVHETENGIAEASL